MNKRVLSAALAASIVFGTMPATAFAAYDQGWHSVNTSQRDYPSKYDAGPAKGSDWAKLFGQTPNYRSLGKAILGGDEEKFRWKFGPMWYRGRLGYNEVKAFVVGQEGAQDENVSNRAFTGSTGTKTQKFLNHLGIKSSYLFLNTFVYTINGQLSGEPAFEWMEQNEDSPIVKYRHDLFDNVAKQNPNKLALLMGIGSGGKRSLETWIRARGGDDCRYISENANTCPTEKFKKGLEKHLNIKIEKDIVAIGVPHPGAASPSNGGLGALKTLIKKFSAAASSVGDKMEADLKDNGKLDWIEPDVWEGQDPAAEARKVARNLKRDYKYGNASVPFFDFAFGTNWRMGSEGTTSNRRGSNTIQVFSDNGRYNNDGDKLKYENRKDRTTNGMFEREVRGQKHWTLSEMKEEDLPYESPKYYEDDENFVNQYDHGPCGTWGDKWNNPKNYCQLARYLQDWPDFWSGSVKPVSAPSFGHGPAYRGNPQNAKIVIIADQQSHDDFFSTRALTGKNGQRLQTYLKNLGAGDEYFIVRTLPVDTLGMDQDDVEKIALRDDVVANQKRILEEVMYNKAGDRPDAKGAVTKAIVTIGPVAKKLADKLGFDKPTFELPNPTGDHVDAYNAKLSAIASAAGFSKNGSYDGSLTVIARNDLPVHTRWWMGTSGDRVSRADKYEGSRYETNGDYYKAFAPDWVSRQRSKALTERMVRYLARFTSFEGSGRSSSEDPALQADPVYQAQKQFEQEIAAWEREQQQKLAEQPEVFVFNNEEYNEEGISLAEVEALIEAEKAAGRSDGIVQYTSTNCGEATLAQDTGDGEILQLPVQAGDAGAEQAANDGAYINCQFTQN